MHEAHESLEIQKYDMFKRVGYTKLFLHDRRLEKLRVRRLGSRGFSGSDLVNISFIFQEHQRIVSIDLIKIIEKSWFSLILHVLSRNQNVRLPEFKSMILDHEDLMPTLPSQIQCLGSILGSISSLALPSGSHVGADVSGFQVKNPGFDLCS